jgi:hypothetical protein
VSAAVSGSGRTGGLLSTARRLSWRDWGTAFEATTWLALARLAILLMPFPLLARRLGASMQETTQNDDERDRPVLRRVRWAIGAVSRRAPWRCMCLEQGLAAKMMLRRRGLASTFYLGVARPDSDAPAKAHAWLRCGSYYVTGGEGREPFTVVSTFADGASE